MGLLRVTGTIDLEQFWPEGESDADTVKVTVDEDGFQFQAHADAEFEVTHVFDDAIVIGSGKKPPVDKKGRITIRLQGIDAPELHYTPTPLRAKEKNDLSDTQLERFHENFKKYRQHYGETAANALHSKLKQSGNDTISCAVTTLVDEPTDVFDTYGRFIGDIIVTIAGKEVDINHWLVEEGWAFATFYSTMTEKEIRVIIDATEKSRKAKKGIWVHSVTNVGKLDQELIYRKGGEFDPSADTGPVFMPKIFRRQCTWTALNKAKIFPGNFQKYLAQLHDECFLTEDFLENGVHSSRTHILSDFIESSGKIDLLPQKLTFKEAPSKLIGPDGKMITKW